ncbi:hypothetical protein PV325_002905 [Microctonus aethiopoides]|nr:hypothetical protein PV325_002905 [Microctonus aethiopoides]
MTTEKDLINAVRDSLEADGGLSRIKAQMRTEVMKIMDGSAPSDNTTSPHSPCDILILNELIREYFDWIGYKYTLSVLTSECELGRQPIFDRTFLAQNLGISENETTKKLPLLFCLMKSFKNFKE